MRIQSTTRIVIDWLQSPEEIADVARFAARFGLPLRLDKTRDKNSRGHVAEMERQELAFAHGDAAASVCAQAMTEGMSVDQVLTQIRNQITETWKIDAAEPFDVSAFAEKPAA